MRVKFNMEPGKYLIDPRSRRRILDEDNPIAIVDDTPFWRRRVTNGDVLELADEPAPEPAATKADKPKKRRGAKKES
jgi:hypothetical protein